jgi:ankyrin repeat protein
LRDLLTAARLGDVAGVKAAIAAGADVNAGDPTYGQTALMRAAMFGQAGTTAALLAARARHDVTAVDERTAMHWAAVGGSADVVRLLVKAGAAVNVEAFGETPLGHAVEGGALGVVAALIEAGATPQSMRQSVGDYVNLVLGNRWQDDRLEIARALVRTKRGLDRPDAQGRPLAIVVAEWAHQAGTAAVARDLRAAGVGLSATDAEGRTALDIVRRKLTTERDPAYRAGVKATLDALEGRTR